MLKGFRNVLRTRRKPRWAQHFDTAPRLCQVEILEQRALLSGISIQFNYTYDTADFFNTQAKKDLLAQAANVYESRINDTLLAITPGGSNTWSEVFTNPANGQNQTIDNPSIAEGVIVVYVGGQIFSSNASELGEGGPGGYSANGDQTWLNTVAARGQAGALATPATDFGPWGGSVSFATNAAWYFGTSATVPSNETDFLSVATHELGHVLGFGTSDSFQALAVNGNYTGAHSEAVYGGPVPLQADAVQPGQPQTYGHWALGVTDDGVEPVMTPTIAQGVRKNITSLDLAGLEDLGWTYSTGPELMYRTYNPQANVHFYTTSKGEFDYVLSHGYVDETTGTPSFSVAADRPEGSLPLHRLYDPNNGLHYYTTSDGERDSLVAAGWTFEGEEGNVFPTQVSGTTEIFRLYNVDSGEHLYVPSDSERVAILAEFPGIWIQNTSLGYAYPSGVNSQSISTQMESLEHETGQMASVGAAAAMPAASQASTASVNVSGLTATTSANAAVTTNHVAQADSAAASPLPGRQGAVPATDPASVLSGLPTQALDEVFASSVKVAL